MKLFALRTLVITLALAVLGAMSLSTRHAYGASSGSDGSTQPKGGCCS
ncbi:MAG: hypothetical protein HY927_01920 [Elusimicrobia bacterium]|nr:hypothetical protein [Elusimicrobiota bacterium]